VTAGAGDRKFRRVADRAPQPEAARRRRGVELEQAIFDAVWAELAESGYSRLTMDGVAARAQTGKQVLYRRWPSRAELVLAALRARSGSILQRVPDTGSLRGDVLTVLRLLATRQRELGIDTIRGLMYDAAEFDPGRLAEITGVYATILDRAVQRGELGSAPIPASVVDAVPSLLRYRLLVSPAPVADAELERLVDEVFLPLVHTHAAGG
jgi:AcrR family transcriptional regulator